VLIKIMLGVSAPEVQRQPRTQLGHLSRLKQRQ
jgi:hypothetical protein